MDHVKNNKNKNELGDWYLENKYVELILIAEN